MASAALAEALLSNKTNFQQFLLAEMRKRQDSTGEFTSLLSDIASSCKVIAMLVNKGPKMGILGSSATQNVQGEEQKTLDVLSNEVFIRGNEYNGLLAGMVSEENDDFIPIPGQYPRGKYLLCFDPLDGSSNIPVNVSVGTIFSIFKIPDGSKAEDCCNATFLQPGSQQVCAGYCLYGPQTSLVMSTGHGVNGFTLDHDVGDFILSNPDMTVPKSTGEYAVNCSNRRHWDAPVRRYVEECEDGATGPRKKNFNMRWVGSMVADVHRILTRGGVFIYPNDAKLRAQGMKGRLRYLYEVAPMSFLMEQAGGASSTGLLRTLDVVPETIHERTPVILGSAEEVEVLAKYYQEWAAEQKAKEGQKD